MTSLRVVPIARVLTAAETDALRDLIRRSNPPETDALLRQIGAAHVVEECSCPCPTITVGIDPRKTSPVSYSARPVATAEFAGGGIMAWVEDGWLSLFELYWWTDDPPSTFPGPSELSNHRAG